MKKHYGPIVLGIIALTLAAPVSNVTTVLAEETPEEQQGGEETGTTEKGGEETDEQPTLEKIQATFNEKLKALRTNDSSNDLKNAQKTTLSNLETAAKEATTTDEVQKLIDQVDGYSKEGATIPYTFTTPTAALIDGKEDYTLKSEDLLINDPSDASFSLNDENSNYLQFINSKGETTSSVPLTLNNEFGELEIDPDYLTDGKINLSSSLTADSIKEDVEGYKTRFTTFSESDKAALDSFYEEIDKKTAVTEDSTFSELLTAKKAFDTIKSSESTTTIHTGKDSSLMETPVLKGSSIAINIDGSSYLNVTFDKDGTKLTKAQIVDKDGNPTKVDKKEQVWMGSFDDSTPTNPVTLDNELKKENNNNPSSKDDKKPEVEKPDITPKHTKSITNHSTNFYSLPNTITTLFDENGNALKNRALGEDSTWYADKLLKLDGVNYLRVATGEWAKLADGLEVTPISQNVFTKNQSRLYTANGDIVTNRALAEDTAWRTDKSATINGQTMYRVATNEWVRASDLI